MNLSDCRSDLKASVPGPAYHYLKRWRTISFKVSFPFNSGPSVPLRLYRRAVWRPLACILSKEMDASRATGTVMLMKPLFTGNGELWGSCEMVRMKYASLQPNAEREAFKLSSCPSRYHGSPDKLTKLVPELDCLAWCVFKTSDFNYVLPSDVETTPLRIHPLSPTHQCYSPKSVSFKA